MRIRCRHLAVVVAMVAMPARAQTTSQPDPIAVEQAWVGTPAAPQPACDNPDPLLPAGEGTIVVCRRANRDRYRVPSSSTEHPLSAEATRTGAPVPPDLGSGVNCASPGAHCMGYAPPPIYYFDITKLPMPAAGSDADRIAKGEAPAP